MLDRQKARAAFAAYVAPYDMENPRIALKVAHTYRVAALCERIARAEGLSSEEADVAWLCGLLHDIGRFEQLRLWNTFRDGDSASHAAIGSAILSGHDPAEVERNVPVRADAKELEAGPEQARLGRMDSFIGDRSWDGAIMAAVGLHSAYRLPDTLDKRNRTFCSIVRDADKIDILRVNCENTTQTVIGVEPDAFLASGISECALRAVEEHRCMVHTERHTPADFAVGMICFAFELVYPESRRIVAEQGYLERMLVRPFGVELPFDSERTQRSWEHIGSAARAVMQDGLPQEGTD